MIEWIAIITVSSIILLAIGFVVYNYLKNHNFLVITKYKIKCRVLSNKGEKSIKKFKLPYSEKAIQEQIQKAFFAYGLTNVDLSDFILEFIPYPLDVNGNPLSTEDYKLWMMLQVQRNHHEITDEEYFKKTPSCSGVTILSKKIIRIDTSSKTTAEKTALSHEYLHVLLYKATGNADANHQQKCWKLI